MLPEPIPELSILNPTPSYINGPKLLHHLVQTSSASAKPAIDFLENGTRRQFSYGRFHTLSDKLASKIGHILSKLKNASVVVPIYLPQSPELYIALIAVLKAGRAFCPLGLDTPAERLNFILDDISADILITDTTHASIFSSKKGLHTLLLDDNIELRSGVRVEQPPHTNTNALAYVLYTSGSTGLPKAVSVSHRAVTQSLLAHDRHIPDFKRFLQFAAPTFDVSIFEIFFPLFRGATLVGCNRAQLLNDLPAIIRDLEVDAAELTPTVVSNLLQGRKSVPGLKLLLTIGEMLTRNVIEEFGGTSSQQSILWGMYGPTEAAIHCTIQPNFNFNSPVGNIGFPLDTVSAFVAMPIDESCSPIDLSVLPAGRIGELVLGGPQVAEGYLNRPELTAAAFIRHPKYGYLYRTGDKARIQNGSLECLGRIVSGQVKLRGQRVELGEIEQVMAKVKNCHIAVAIIIAEDLVAFCADRTNQVTKESVLETCRRWLPAHMIPADLVVVSQMPQLSSGKIDKKALEAQYRQQRGVDRVPQSQSIENGTDSHIPHTIERILGRKLSPSTQLAYAGLDSLRAIQISSALRKQGFSLSATDLLTANSLRDVSAMCQREHREDMHNASADPQRYAMESSVLSSPDICHSKAMVEAVIPCTPLQEAMLAETITRPSAYCNWIEVEVSKPHRIETIRSSLHLLALAHEILRSGFCVTVTSSRSFAQVIWKELAEYQLLEVTNFSRTYSLGSSASLLRPLTVQIRMRSGRPRMLFQIHHALYDGWSFDLLLRDFQLILAHQILDPRPQFRALSEYFAQLRAKDQAASSNAYWSNLLLGYQPQSLPNFNGKRVHPQPLRSISYRSSVDTGKLTACAQSLAINPQVFYQAAIIRLVGSYTSSSDVVIGTVTSGRTLPVPGIEEIVGPCIASLPLRIDLSQYDTVSGLLNAIHNANRGMLPHCTVPLTNITKLSGLHPGTPLFDVLFVWQQSLFSSDATNTTIKVVESADDLGFKLTLEFEPLDDGIISRANYSPSLFPEPQVETMLRQIDELVIFLLQNLNGGFQAVAGCFSSQTLSIANPFPSQERVSHGPAFAVEQHALHNPDEEALVFGSVTDGAMAMKETLNYAQLNSRANQLAYALLDTGVEKDELICVLMEKSVNLYVSILAILKVGNGYVPIVPDSPPDRISKILGDARVRICLSERSTTDQIHLNERLTILHIDELDVSKYSDNNLDIQYHGSHLAYAVFTSGSTGTPKGVLVTQDNLMSNLMVLSDIYPTPRGSRLLQSCSQAFDVSVFEIFFSWYAGICLCSATKDDLYDNLEGSINNLGITHLSLTPTVASLVNPDHVPKVNFLVTAGEAVTEHVRRGWADKGLHQGYGPSETTNICTVRAAMTEQDLINNIGAPFKNTSVLVLDPSSEDLLPRGAIGELCFGGAQVFRGYLNMPELNARKILNHPKYGRIYRSGDMGLLLPDDSILFTGRLDDQVKIRGQRVELGEITATILDNPDVEDCFTLLVDDDNTSQKLISFWVPHQDSCGKPEVLAPGNHGPVIDALFESLSLSLPTYMVPTHLIPITQIPLTPQTKIDKRLLMATYKELSNQILDSFTSTSSSDSGVLPFSERESRIAEALAETVDVPLSDISRTSSFFSLGLDSISAIRLCKRLRDSQIMDVPVSAILKNPTVAKITAKFTTDTVAKTPTMHNSVGVQLLPSELIHQVSSNFKQRGIHVNKVLPCTSLQEAMLSSEHNSAYHNIMRFKVHGDVTHLRTCWDEMFQRHSILRTAFASTDYALFAFVQVVSDYPSPQWDVLEQGQDVDDYVARLLPDLLASWKPPVRLALREYDDETEIFFCCHHALYDGIAITNLLTEVENVYHGTLLRQPVPYEEYLQRMVEQDLEEADHFWHSSLLGLKPTFFPDLTGKPMNTSALHLSHTQVLQIPLQRLTSFCRGSSVSLLPLIQAAWAKVLHFYVAEDDLCFGNVVSGRSSSGADLDRLVAPCFNTLPVRVKFDFRGSNASLIQTLHKFNIEASPFQLMPLRRIQSKVLKGQGHLFDTLVILQQHSLQLDDTIWTLEDDVGTMDLPVVCEVFQDSARDCLTTILHFQTSLLSAHDAAHVVDTFHYALTSLVQHPNSAAKDTIGFPASLLAESNIAFTSFAFSGNALLHSAFEQNAAKYPERVALDFQLSTGEKVTWSYRTLNATANRVSHALTEHGVGQDDIIPIIMPKSPYFYASLLGTLKAGAAFAPVHPDLPLVRKQFMMSELQPKVILHLHDVATNWCGGVHKIDASAVDRYSSENVPSPTIAPTSLAYCLYTSGSTGVPKAVVMDHRSPMHTVESSRNLVPWDSQSRLLQYAAISFDMCYYDCFLAWSFGFTLCAGEQDEMLNNLSEIINTLNADLLDLTPSVASSISKAQVPNVKWLYCIGEPMSAAVIQEWEDSCVNSYGPTEAAFCTTMFPVQKSSKSTVIGKPFASTSFAVFPKHGERTLPIFGEGELYIGGSQLARGYHGRPDLTEDKFVQRNGQRFYKSGDIVRMLGDGNFEFIGRVDDQVKIRGLRVELGEINHVLQACDKRISSVSAQILKTGKGLKEQLVAFLALVESCTAEDQIEIKQTAIGAARASLPMYMNPQFFIFIDKMPKSSAGKVDKNALAQAFAAESEVNRSAVGTGNLAQDHNWTKVENVIREILATLSSIPIADIGPDTSIYQLGLDSISAVQVAAGIRKRGYQVNATEVLRLSSCAELAAHIDDRETHLIPRPEMFDFDSFEHKIRPEVIESHDILDEDIEAVYPCTPLQQGMLSQFISQDGAVYFNYLQLRLESGVDLSRMQNAWQAILEKHQILRTGFAQTRYAEGRSFAMIQYAPAVYNLPWEEGSEGVVLVHDWLQRVRSDTLDHLYQPPWRIRVNFSHGQAQLDLAIFHAIFDAQSLQIILNDVSNAYRGASIDSSLSLKPTLNYILQQSRTGNTRSVEFWKQLGKKLTKTKFPNLTPVRFDPATPAVIAMTSSKPLSELEAGCRASNITLQAAGIASWASLLCSYTGEESVTCGVVLSGRHFEGAESVAFPCISTVPFPVTRSDNKQNMLEEIMNLNADIQEHQFTPLNEIQKLVGHPTESLFDSLFAFQKLSKDGKRTDPWTIVDENATIEYPISIELEPAGEHLELRLTFLPHVVPQEHASIILSQLDHLLEQFVFSDTTTCVDPTTQEYLYSITPAKEPILPSHVQLLHEFVEYSATEQPHTIALDFATALHNGSYDNRTWTYTELDGEGNKIAHMLIKHGVLPGDLVGVCFDKCPEASFAMLGILKAGCAFVALDPNAPSARRAFIVEDAGVKIVLSMQAQSSDLSLKLQARIVNLDEINLSTESTDRPVLGRSVSPQDRSYCLYTSGTTGTPKGCELTHENAVQAMLAFQRLFAGHWDNESRWLQFASFHFDVSVLEQYWSWSVGICVVSAPRDLIFEDLAVAIRTLGITHIDLTPSLARILHPDDVPSLCKGVFITGGESLKQEILDVWGPKGVIYNGYGPTEATIGVTMYPRVPANGKPTNIGPQFDNVGSYVLKPGSNRTVLRGGVGELCVSGRLVGKGYLNRPELTQEQFPVLTQHSERVYRTGDLVRILHDGSFSFLGRADDQVKLRGQRLEIGEINSVIKQSGDSSPDVATLVLRHPKQQKEQLVTFIVVASKTHASPHIVLENTPALERAKEACHNKLPGYMVPTHFVALSAMPLSANNKADNRRLKEMYDNLSASEFQTLAGLSQDPAGDWTSNELKIRDTLHEILQTDLNDITRSSNVFELGLDSISVIGFSNALKQAGFAQATASTVLKYTSIYKLANVLADSKSVAHGISSIAAAQQLIMATQHKHRRGVADALKVRTEDIEALAPCTPLQQGMIARSLESDNGTYFNTFRFKLSSNVNDLKLHDAWAEVFASTQILRTVFCATEDGSIQTVIRQLTLPWAAHELLKDDDLEARIRLLRDQWWQRNRTTYSSPFELHLVKMPQGKVLVIHIFHGLYDGISIQLLFDAVWKIYCAQPSAHTSPTFHSVLAQGPLRSNDDAREFWIARTPHKRSLQFPALGCTSKDRPTTVVRELPYLVRYENVRKRIGVTHQSIAQACWATVLQKHVGYATSIGVIVSGRSIDFPGAERVVGPMFNTIPYQHRLQDQQSWASIIKRTQEFNVAAHPYQHTPIRDIMRWCKRAPDQPLFDTLFVYQIAGKREESIRNELWELIDSEAEADYPLALEVEQTEECLRLTLVTQGHIADESVSNQLLDKFDEALVELLNDPNAVVESVDINEKDTREQAGSAMTMNGEIGQPSIMVNSNWTNDAKIIRDTIAGLASIELEDITERTSIFEVGLDSIDAIKLSSKLKKLGVDLPVSGIMRGLTIKNMLGNIRSQKSDLEHEPSDNMYELQKKELDQYMRQHKVQTDEHDQILPMTPLQEGMVADMIASDYTRYYNHDVLRLSPNTDMDKLRDAWKVVVEQLPILRTSFVEVDEPNIDLSLAQIIHERPHNFITYEKWEEEPDFHCVFDMIRENAKQNGLSRPLFDVYFIDAPGGRYLILSIAHALYDGWSLGLLHTDVQRAYAGQLKPRLEYEFALRQILSTSGSDAEVFWRDFLAGAKPAVFSRRANSSPMLQSVHREERVSLVALDDVTAFAKRNNITLQTLGQTSFALMLASYVHSLDVTFGTVLSGRDDEDLSEVVFPTMNTVAVRTILHGTRQEMLQYVQENFAQSKQYQHFPLRRAQVLAGTHGGLIDSLFIYQKGVGDQFADAMNLYESVEDQSSVEYPVCVEMEVTNAKLVWRCAIQDAVFDRAEVSNLLEILDMVMRSILEHPEASVIDFAPTGLSVCGLPAFKHQPIDEPAGDPAQISTLRNPDSATSKIIREVLASVSKIPEEEIQAGMTIFHIGLDSISAIKVSSQLRKRSIILSVGEMIKSGTVEKMAKLVDERMPTGSDSEIDDDTTIKDAMLTIDEASLLHEAAIDKANVECFVPATAGQLYMISMWINTNGATFYPEFGYHIKGTISLEDLRSAWTALVAANPILRTCILASNVPSSPYVQAILLSATCNVVDITGLNEQQAQTLIGETLQPYAHLFVSKTELGWDAHFKVHHALYDGVSLELLVQQFQNICNRCQPTTTTVSALRQFIAASCTPTALEARKAFWTNYLQGVEQHRLPQPYFAPKSKTEMYIPGLLDSVDQIDHLARKKGVSTQSFFLATYTKIYATLTGIPKTSDVVIGIYLANRSHSAQDISTFAIPTVNLVPLRAAAPLSTSTFDLAVQIQKDIQEISTTTNSIVSLVEIQAWTGVLLDTFVNFLKLPDSLQNEEMIVDDSPQNVCIEKVGQWNHRICRVIQPSQEGFKIPRKLQDERVQGAYLHAIDVEATIRNGALDVGVFAPEEMLSLEDGHKLMDKLKRELGTVEGVVVG